jgi:hypothetical protein
MKTSSFLMVGLVLVGCGGGEAFIDEGDESFDAAEGPLLGADGKDAADRSCNVVLRSLKRTSATKCTASAGCSVCASYSKFGQAFDCQIHMKRILGKYASFLKRISGIYASSW